MPLTKQLICELEEANDRLVEVQQERDELAAKVRLLELGAVCSIRLAADIIGCSGSVYRQSCVLVQFCCVLPWTGMVFVTSFL